MKTKHLAALMREDITTVAVHFEGDLRNRGIAEGIRRFDYLMLRIDAANVRPGTAVAVPTADGSMKIAVVAEVHEEPNIDPDAEYEYKFVVGVIDTERYNQIVQHHAEMQKTLLSVEKEVKRRSVLDMYQEAIKSNTRLSGKFEALRQGPALAAPALAAPAAQKKKKKDA